MSRGAAQVPPPIDPEEPSAPATKRGRPKGSKVSNQGRLNMIKSWEDPARLQKYKLRMIKAGRGPSLSSTAFIDPDFDEER